MADFGTHYKLLINDVELFTPEVAAPKLPVARVMWKVKPDFHSGVTKWIQEGGGHHTVVSLDADSNQIIDLAKMFNLEFVLIS